MRVLRAEVLGMCFGVRDALTKLQSIERPDTVTIHGELVHNEQVLTQLRWRGFPMVQEQQRHELPPTDTVLITAHGVSSKERQRLTAAGKELIDTTCPLVTRAHQAAQKLQEQGYHVLLIGKRGHVEVQGVVEDLDSFDVIDAPDEVRCYEHFKLGVMCQTTATEAKVAAVRARIAERNPHAQIRFVDTVCHPTKDHQRALERLLDEVEAMVVVGGANSNNTRELVARCRAYPLPTWHVQSAVDLRPEWFADVRTVGLTAGTSTLDEAIDAVQQALERLTAADCSAAAGLVSV